MPGRRGQIREQPGPPLAWLPHYVIRHNPAARRLRISISPGRGVVVTVPRGSSVEAAVAFLAEKRPWVERNLQRLRERDEHHTRLSGDLPAEVVFPALGERWLVEHRPTDSSSVRSRRTPARPDDVGDVRGRLVLSGDIADDEACVRSLNRFVDARAKETLPAEVARLSRMHGLAPGSVTVRHQRTRWGSCSTTGAISLNRTLLFLPRDLALSVILHELAHLAHHDHSERFWRELERLDPEARAHRRAMRDAWRHVPAWAAPPHPRSSGDT